MSSDDRTPGRPTRSAAAVGAVLGVGVVAVLAAATGSAWLVTERFTIWDTAPSSIPRGTPPVEPALPRPVPPAPTHSGWLAPLLWVLLAAAVLLAAYLVWRRLPRRSAHAPAPSAGEQVVAGPGADPAAPAVREGLGTAQSLLDSVSDPTDAVLAAWVALEAAAERSGVARRRADTPTEFTGTVLTGTPADAEAVHTLLRLYHQARFSAGGVGPDAVVEARECVASLARSWSGFAAVRVPVRDEGGRGA